MFYTFVLVVTSHERRRKEEEEDFLKVQLQFFKCKSCTDWIENIKNTKTLSTQQVYSFTRVSLLSCVFSFVFCFSFSVWPESVCVLFLLALELDFWILFRLRDSKIVLNSHCFTFSSTSKIVLWFFRLDSSRFPCLPRP